MTVLEKKNSLKKIIDSLSKENLDEAYFFINQLSTKEQNRISIVKTLLKDESSLFEKLAQ